MICADAGTYMYRVRGPGSMLPTTCVLVHMLVGTGATYTYERENIW